MNAIRGTLTLEGGAELERKLRALPPKVEKRLAKKAIRTGLKPMLAAARAGAPILTGFLRKRIKLRTWRRTRKGIVGLSITASAENNEFQGKAFYGAFQEFGWKTGKRSDSNVYVAPFFAPIVFRVRRGKKAHERKQMAGRHFLQQAFDQTKDQSVKLLGSALGEGIEREARSS